MGLGLTPTNRRFFLKRSGLAIGAAVTVPGRLFSAEQHFSKGAVVGEATAARVGQKILEDGGNAIDAAIGAALAACVVSIHNCGIGGYGGHMVIARRGSLSRTSVTAIDFNSIAPSAAREDMFPVDEAGKVRDRVNETGWLAAGVPGTLAGLTLALERYGSWSFRDVAAPAIEMARDGFALGVGGAGAIGRTAALLKTDPASARLYFRNGEPMKPAEHFSNPELADLLETPKLVGEFYRGSIARQIAQAFADNGGLVTTEDMAAYAAREVKPVELTWNDWKIYTAPLTAGGLTVVEALSILKALRGDAPKALARLEALRVAWDDRLALLGDPEKPPISNTKSVSQDLKQLLSENYAQSVANRVRSAVRNGKPLSFSVESRNHTGTVHLSAGDSQGNLVALTLTHGNSFGARVTVPGLGLTLGHGMSRFEPKPGHPNAPGPRKRPLHNMCPTIVTRSGRPVIAIGGAGGRKIPNSVFEVLAHVLVDGFSMNEAIAAPRLHTEGDMNLLMEAKWPSADTELLKSLGYKVTTGTGALISAVWRDSQTGQLQSATR